MAINYSYQQRVLRTTSRKCKVFGSITFVCKGSSYDTHIAFVFKDSIQRTLHFTCKRTHTT